MNPTRDAIRITAANDRRSLVPLLVRQPGRSVVGQFADRVAAPDFGDTASARPRWFALAGGHPRKEVRRFR